MKHLTKFGIGALLVTMFGIGAATINFGQQVPAARAIEGTEAVGIIVKNGTKMDTLLAANFVLSEQLCDPHASSSPMCPVVLYENRPVNVYYTADDNMIGKQSFLNRLGNFPFAGRIDYVNRAQRDIEPALIQFMLEQGNATYTIINE